MDLTAVAYATLGLSLLVSAIKMGNWILNANPRAIINAGRWGLIALAAFALVILSWLILSGRWTPAMMLAAFMLPVLVQAAPRWRVLFGPLNPMKGGVSSVTPDVGAGVVPSRSPTGSVDPELVRQSIAVLMTYLERTASQLEYKPADGRFASGATKGADDGRGRISREEALDVLGLTSVASAQEITDAHRRLAQRFAPELGGTHYLVMKINEARDVLLEE